MISLFTGSKSGSGVTKNLKIRLPIRIQGWNHNTSNAFHIIPVGSLTRVAKSETDVVGEPRHLARLVVVPHVVAELGQHGHEEHRLDGDDDPHVVYALRLTHGCVVGAYDRQVVVLGAGHEIRVGQQDFILVDEVLQGGEVTCVRTG